MFLGLDWFWWILIVVVVVIIGALKLRVWKTMTKKKPSQSNDNED